MTLCVRGPSNLWGLGFGVKAGKVRDKRLLWNNVYQNVFGCDEVGSQKAAPKSFPCCNHT